jgi:predicted metal-dependent hydrolase
MHEYTIRVSPRARYVRLVISAGAGLEVVVPRGFDQSRVPELVRQKDRWIENAVRRIQEPPRPVPAEEPAAPPDRIRLPAIGEEWTVEYRPGPRQGLAAAERDGHVLTLIGNVGDAALCRRLLGRWLALKAKRHIGPWLAGISAETGLGYSKATFRGQRSRWGSCSRRGTISLNYKLLFLREDLVRHVLLHELCHTTVPDHSGRFWSLLAAKDPGWREARAAIRTAWRDVPRWV